MVIVIDYFANFYPLSYNEGKDKRKKKIGTNLTKLSKTNERENLNLIREMLKVHVSYILLLRVKIWICVNILDTLRGKKQTI